MIVVVHFCAKDAWLAEKNLKWCIHLEGKTRQHALLAHDTETPEDIVQRIRELAVQYFAEVSDYVFGAPRFKSWPWAPNHCWQEVARHIPTITKDSWLWWESDATPLRKGWLNDIEDEYNKCKQPFMGAFISGVVPWGHMNGCGVYPNEVARFSQQAFFQTVNRSMAWDVAMSKEIRGKIHPANHLFQHCWTWDAEGNPSLGGNIVPSFPTFEDLKHPKHYVQFNHAIYHRCKDGSIIDRMMENETRLAHEAAIKLQPKIGFVGLNEILPVEVPATTVRGPCGILIVTYKKDFPWLKYSIRSIQKFCSGFSGVTVAVPKTDVYEYFKAVGRPPGVKPIFYEEVEGKGMLHHMERICHADVLLPTDQFVLHVDADCIFTDPVTPSEYIVENKPVYVVRSYESLIDRATGKVSDCLQWKKVAEENIGEPVDIYTMCRHPSCFPRSFYPAFREHIRTKHGMTFRDFVLSKKNAFPQTFAEFPAMGGWAWNHMHDAFHWIRVDQEGAPKDKLRAFWSHGGIDQKMESGQTFKEWAEALLA